MQIFNEDWVDVLQNAIELKNVVFNDELVRLRPNRCLSICMLFILRCHIELDSLPSIKILVFSLGGLLNFLTDLPRNIEGPRAQIYSQLRVLVLQKSLLILPQKQHPLLDRLLQVLPFHLALVPDVNVLKVAELVGDVVSPPELLLLLMQDHLLVDRLEERVLDDVVESANHLL